MNNYDFNTQLTPLEFEDLGCDIVELRENITLERFKKNNDLGIDGRHINGDGVLIVQCKRVKNINTLISQLKNEELKKVMNINPKRYILVLSSNPTVKQKIKIFDLFRGFIHSPSDIITAEDINSYLRKPLYSKVYQYYDKLILSKNINLMNLIDAIPDDPLKNKSISLTKDINEIKKYFIETKTYCSSYANLLKNHIIFLSGDAGSGKTTNAKMLLNQLLVEQFVDSIYQVDSCEEITTLMLSDRRIGILYDDFWGSTFSDLKLPLNSEKRLQDLLYKIGSMENIYFILTTREYVLNQGLSFYKDFYNNNLDKRIIHKNCNYTKKEKAKILFAHAKNSNLDFECLYMIKSYANQIIDSRNYSPRSISFFIDKYQDISLDATEFIKTFLEYLNNPADFLNSIFYKLSLGARILAFTISISNPEVLLSVLKKSFQSIAKKIDGIKPSLFDEYLKELFDFFVTNYYSDSNLIQFTNYSIFDFINSEFTSRIIDYEDEFSNGVFYFNQIYNLLMKFDLSIENQDILINKLINNFDELLITHDDEIFLLANEIDVDPSTYISHKIWETLHIAKKTNNANLKSFLFHRINLLITKYDNKKHHFEDKNFICIPEIVEYAEKLGIKFCDDEIVKFYLNNFNYLFELSYVKYFPKEYKKIISIEMEELGKKLRKNIENRLVYELEVLSFDGITIEYDFTIDDLPGILKMLKITKSKMINKILDSYRYNFPDKKGCYDDTIKINTRMTTAEKEIEKFGKQLLYDKKLSKTKWICMIKESSLNDESKKQLVKSTRETNGIWSLLDDSTVEYANFILSYYKVEEIKNHMLITTSDIFLSLLEFINDFEEVKFLKRYAYDTISNCYNPLSNSHICKKYDISNSVIENLINLGILYRNNNIVGFSNNKFQILCSKSDK